MTLNDRTPIHEFHNLLARMILISVGVEHQSSLEFITNIYPLQVDLRIIPMCSHEVLPAGQKMARLHMVGSVVT